MNRLWVRLSLAFGFFVLLGVLGIVMVARLLVSDRINQFLLPAQLRAPDGIVETLENFYRTHGSWEGVDDVLRGIQAATPLWSSRLELTLADAEGDLIYRIHPSWLHNPTINPTKPSLILPIQIDGQTIGELQVRARSMRMGNQSGLRNLAEQMSSILLLLALGGGVGGLVVSVLISRNLTAPLSRLAEAAHDIGARRFHRRVEPSGSAEMVEVAQAFNQMAARLEESETLRRNLVADVAHELRTPLTVLQGNLRGLLDDVYALDKAEVTRLYTQTRLLARLVNDLHELAQAEAGQLSLTLQPLDLAHLIRETVDSYWPAGEEAGIRLQVEMAEALPTLQADAARLTQVLHNLLTNALRHTSEDGVITIRAEKVGEQLWFSVEDTGEGIAPEHLAHIFDRFYRADRARSRDRGGVGLGLAIVRAIVQAHSGEVTVQSAGLGKGSTFTVKLPVGSTSASA
jgi:two-component system OmpR family sensor kinase/two-component system sensor histidine kinase BaeS